MAHYDVAGELRPHVRGQVDSLAASFDRVVVCTTAPLKDSARAWLSERAELVERANYGYDFFSYKVGLDAVGDLSGFDEVVVCNDSYVFAHDNYDRIIEEMRHRPCDFWGLTAANRVAPPHPVVLHRLPPLGRHLADVPDLLGGDGADLQTTSGHPSLRDRHVSPPLRGGLRLRQLLRRDRGGSPHRARAGALVGGSPVGVPPHPDRAARVARTGQGALEPGSEPGRSRARRRASPLRQDRHPALRPLQPRRGPLAHALRAPLPRPLRRRPGLPGEDFGGLPAP
ncbi:hypothetical protein EXE58_00965 [Nocardioides seonyuensis]|uniref:Uncharacterized protein n=1 Tax=Nocardioides seonyuensis TaxID=2518371 RepID=A0A4P7IET1_9ACTN|nr:hypothetical protein EXE58_00965 [Nocardioides seonyuensis]